MNLKTMLSSVINTLCRGMQICNWDLILIYALVKESISFPTDKQNASSISVVSFNSKPSIIKKLHKKGYKVTLQ